MAKKKINKGAAILKRVTARAKKIRAYAGGSWKSAQAKAWSEYRGDKKTTVKRKMYSSKKKHKTVGSTSVGKDTIDRKKVSVNIGGISAARAKSVVRTRAKEKLMSALYARDQAKNKTARKKASKRITAARREVKSFS